MCSKRESKRFLRKMNRKLDYFHYILSNLHYYIFLNNNYTLYIQKFFYKTNTYKNNNNNTK